MTSLSPGHHLSRQQIARHGRDRYPTRLQQAAKVIDEASELLTALVEHIEIHGQVHHPSDCSHLRGEYADAGLALYALGDKLGLDLIDCMQELVEQDTRDFSS